MLIVYSMDLMVQWSRKWRRRLIMRFQILRGLSKSIVLANLYLFNFFSSLLYFRGIYLILLLTGI